MMPMNITGVRSNSGSMSVSVSGSVVLPGPLSTDDLTALEGNIKMEKKIPAKLRSRRVIRHVETCLAWIQRSRGCVRDARRVRQVSEISWESYDLYTLAMDLAHDDELRILVAQARACIAGRLMQT